LRFDGRIAAAIYGLRWGSRAFAYLTAFDSKLAHLSPGLLLLTFAMQEAVREGAVEFDFLRGREPYKYLWSPHERPQFRRRIQR
jgi:CelD/BcsL family acetyltransferase involved in cellulose biosynthesis